MQVIRRPTVASAAHIAVQLVAKALGAVGGRRDHKRLVLAARVHDRASLGGPQTVDLRAWRSASAAIWGEPRT